VFARTLRVESVSPKGEVSPCPVGWIDNFAMRNFTNDAIFDDTLPIADGVMEVGHRVPLELLREKMQAWFLRKQFLKAGDALRITEQK
jgi:hypothetical protein